MSALPPIDYATPTRATPPTEAQFRRAITCWAIAAGVAIFLLLAFAITEWSPILFAGFLWLGAGGVVTLVAFVLGVNYCRRAAATEFAAPHTRRRAVLGTLLPASNVPLAVACVVAGAMLASSVSYRMSITIDNPSPLAVDDLTFVMPDASRRSLGGIDAQASRDVELSLPRTGGDVHVDVTRSGHTWRQFVGNYVDDDDLPSVEHVTVVEPTR